MKTNKGFIVPLLLGVIALLVIAGGVYIYQNKKPETILDNTVPQLNSIQQEVNTNSPSADISNWKTYKNSQYGFEFQYPSDLTYKEIKGTDSAGVNYFNVNVDTKENIEFTCEGCDGPVTFFMVSSYNKNGDPIANCSSNSQFQISKVTVGEFIADKCVSDGLNDPILGIDIPRGGIASQHIYAQNYQGEHKALVDQILSTFKFIPPTGTTKINCDDYYNKKLVASCSVSPDGKWAVGEAFNYGGLRVIEASTGKVTILSKERDDIYRLWFSDSRRILGFAGSFPSMDCEGDAIQCPRGVPDNRKIVIWDIKSKTFTNVPVQTPPLSYDMEWIVPDHTAYIYAHDMSGSEGSNFYYTLNLDTQTISGPTKNSQLR